MENEELKRAETKASLSELADFNWIEMCIILSLDNYQDTKEDIYNLILNTYEIILDHSIVSCH
jgi:hypothetical protein